MKATPLNKIHKQLGARMVDFAGWEMPVQYTGVREEHLAVRTKAGIFDVSHMGEIIICGPQAEAVVQKLTCNDASRLKPGESQYSALLTERGTFVDDIIVNRLAPELFLICVNASNANKDFAWVRPYAVADTTIENRSDDYFQIAIQGPGAIPMVEAIQGKGASPPPRAFTLIETTLAGCSVLLSRTGYTGEDGYEIYGRPADAEKIWTLLMEHGALPCGLGARDTLRLEAAMPLYGHEIDDSINPFEAGLGWIVKMEKGNFIGSESLRKIPPRPPLLKGGIQLSSPFEKGGWGDLKQLVGIEMTEPGIARQGCKVFDGEKEIGFVTSGTKSPFLNKAVAMSYVAAAFAVPTTKIAVDIHSKKRHGIIVPLPFYKRRKD